MLRGRVSTKYGAPMYLFTSTSKNFVSKFLVCKQSHSRIFGKHHIIAVTVSLG